MRAARELTRGAHERDLPVRPPTESELMAMSRRHLSTDGPQKPTSIVPLSSSTGCKRFAVDTERCLLCQLLSAPHWLQCCFMISRRELPPRRSYGMASEGLRMLVRSSDFLLLVWQCRYLRPLFWAERAQ